MTEGEPLNGANIRSFATNKYAKHVSASFIKVLARKLLLHQEV